MPSRQPAFDDEGDLGVSFFRTHLEDADLSGLTLPRTFFGRSLVARCSWSGTDLSESQLAWNDFEDVDFSGALLVRADLRASNYERCRFDGADLSGADLRNSAYLECSFRGAQLAGARVARAQLSRLGLDAAQLASVSVEVDDEEDVPEGG